MLYHFLLLAVTIYLTAILVSNLNSLWETSIQNFSFMIIFPIGAAAVAALAVSGLYFGRWIGKLTFKKYYLWIALVAGAMSFFCGDLYGLSTYAHNKYCQS